MSKRFGVALTIVALLGVLVGVKLYWEGSMAVPTQEVGDVPQAWGTDPDLRRPTPPSVPFTVDTLSQVRVIGAGDDFGQIVVLGVSGNVLFAGDSHISPHVAMVDLTTGELIARVGRHGEGPGEFQAPSGMSRVRGAGPPAVWVHDFYNRRVSRIQFTAGGEFEVDSVIPLMVATSTENPEIIGDRVASAGLFGDEAVIMFFDRTGRPLSKIGRPPFALKDVGHAIGVRLLNRASMAANPAGDRMAVAFYSANRMDIYSSDGELLHSSSGPRSIDASFYVEDNRFFWRPGRNQLAYMDIATTDERIFLLFCGCTLDEEDDADRTTIHVFDWDGVFRRELVLPVSALGITVDDAGENLYTAAEDPWPRIYQWAIPPTESR